MAPDKNGTENGAVRENRMYKIMGILLSIVSIVLIVSTYQVTQITNQITIMSEAVAANTKEIASLPSKFVSIPKYERVTDIKDRDLMGVRDALDQKLFNLETRTERSNAAIIEQMRCIVEQLNKLFGSHERLTGKLDSVFKKYEAEIHK